MNNFCKVIKSEQEWHGNIYNFDPDSSPEAWEHYKKYYTAVHWDGVNDYILNKLHFFEYVEGNYVDEPLSFYNRLNALSANVEADKRTGYYTATIRLSGETDFNFNDKKYDEFMKKLFVQYKNNEEDLDNLRENIATLNKCSKMHHTVLNFSLMQVVGNMQGFKSKGLLIKNKYEYLDRLDTFVYRLNEYYTENKENRVKSNIIQNATKQNREALGEYLEMFNSVYDYCEKIYFIKTDDETKKDELVNKLIESGSKPIDSGSRVVEYMEVAIKFWEKKANYFKNEYCIPPLCEKCSA